MAFSLIDQPMIHLDDEALAELGIAEAYERLLPELCKYVSQPERIEEVIDEDMPSYSVRCDGVEFAIVGPDLPESEDDNSRRRAMLAFFALVNQQLAGSTYRFRALNNGNDLAGVFLTAAQALESRRTLLRRHDWPYLPIAQPPWYGQHH